MRDLLRCAHFVVRIDDYGSLVERHRTSTRFASVAEIHTEYARVVHALEAIDRPRYACLVDLRESPSRNDPAYEEAVAQYHAPLYRGFARNAVVVQTAAGKLQLLRIARHGSLSHEVFIDEGAARAWLASPAVIEAPRPSGKPPRRARSRHRDQHPPCVAYRHRTPVACAIR